VYGKPVVFGPVYEKYAEATGLIDCGGAFSASGPLDLDKLLNRLFNDETEMRKAGMAAKDFVYDHRGATQKILDYIERNRLLIN